MEIFPLLPGDIFKEIGLLLDWKTIYCKYRLLSKQFYRLCDEKFWLEKLDREYKDALRSKLYQESFCHYLAEESRKLQSDINQAFAQKKKEKFKRKVLELSPIQKILLRKLKTLYPHSFKLHKEDMDRMEYLNHMSKCEKFKPYDLYLNFEIDPDLGPYHQIITVSIFTDRDGEMNMCQNGNPPLVFYEFVWELGLTLSTVADLYGFQDGFRSKGPYKMI